MTPEILGALSQGELVSPVVRLVEDNQRLATEVASLKAELSKNSGNSSKPPSRDPAVERERQAEARRAKRSKGGQRRQPGKQPGAAGKTLEMAENPDEIVTHEPTQCSGCGAGLGEGDELVGTRRRQVVDLPEPKAVVTEHQARTLSCSAASRSLAATRRARFDWSCRCAACSRSSLVSSASTPAFSMMSGLPVARALTSAGDTRGEGQVVVGLRLVQIHEPDRDRLFCDPTQGHQARGLR